MCELVLYLSHTQIIAGLYKGFEMFLIMGLAHLFASLVLFVFDPQSADMVIHAIGGLVEFSIGLAIVFANKGEFSI